MKSGYAPVNGLKMYYEVYGAGKPLILLHGSYMTLSLNFGSLIPELAKDRMVIAVEMQGHGHTADIDRPFSFEALADDVAALMQYLKIDSADILGYSLGGTVAIQLGIRHPASVRKMVVVSAVYKHDGWLPAVNEIIGTITPEAFDQTPLKTEYDRTAPDPKHWKEFVAKLSKFETQPYDFGADKVKAMPFPVLLITGDSDGVDLDHVVDMFRLWGGGVFGDMVGLPKSQLAIIPAATHVGLMMEPAKLLAIIPPFLDAP